MRTTSLEISSEANLHPFGRFLSKTLSKKQIFSDYYPNWAKMSI